MLVLPYQTKFAPRSLPLATLALILACVLVYALLQSRDDAHYAQAAEAWAASELPKIELPRYKVWLGRIDTPDARHRLQALERVPDQAMMVMTTDAAFMAELRGGRVVAPGDPQYPRWREERKRIDDLLAQVFTEKYSLVRGGEAWRWVTHQFLHGDVAHLVGNMIVLLVAGPFVEALLGRVRFVLGYLAAGAFAGAAHMLTSPAGLIGASGAISGAMAMVAVLYGLRRVRVFYWVFVYFDTARVPALALLPIWIGNEVVQLMLAGGQSRVAYTAHLGGFLAGALIAWVIRPRDPHKVDQVVDAEFAGEKQAERSSSLVRQAQDAAARLDTKRAARLYRELVELHPNSVEYLGAYFNVALLAHEQERLVDAALRVLWYRGKNGLPELRKLYLQIAQPKVLTLLPVDEQLRMARRLVRAREDAASLRVLDRLLEDTNLRTLYARQTADCLLGLYTTYSRYGLKQQAEGVRQRLAHYFPQPTAIGGLAPKVDAPPTIRPSTRSRPESMHGPDTIYIDLSR